MLSHNDGITFRKELAIEEAAVGRHGDLALPDLQGGTIAHDLVLDVQHLHLEHSIEGVLGVVRHGWAGRAQCAAVIGSPSHMHHTREEIDNYSVPIEPTIYSSSLRLLMHSE